MVLAQLLPGYVAHLPGRPGVRIRANNNIAGLVEVRVGKAPWQEYDARGLYGQGDEAWLVWQEVADGVWLRATTLPAMRWEIRRSPTAASNGGQPGRHRVEVLVSVTDPARDWQMVHLACPVVDCAAGRVEGAPSAWIGRVAAALQAEHTHLA